MKVNPYMRWLSKVNKTNSCWIWLGKLDAYGYGTIRIDKKMKKAHRIGYEFLKGIIPIGFEIDHLCRNRACVNPQHLESVSPRENILRGYGRGAIEARMNNCKNGHPLSGNNLYIAPSSKKRRCKTCSNGIFKKWKLEHPYYWKKYNYKGGDTI